jgi:elongation factor Ts
MGGKIGVLISARAGSDAAAKSGDFGAFLENTAMQAAAMSPQFLSSAEVPAEAKAKQSEIFDAQLVEEGKPEKARPKIIEGKIAKWLKEVCLLEQDSVLESGKTVDQIRRELGTKLGGEISVTRFARFERGEGVEKPQGDDFAAEVAKMAGG